MFVQSFLDAQRRFRLLAFAAVCFGNLGTDLLFPVLDKSLYELLRVIGWALYGPAVLFLLGGKLSSAAGAAGGILVAGLSTYLFVDRNLATTITLPLSFFTAAVSHARSYRASQGYSSCVLTAVSFCQALQCSFFFSIISLGVPAFNALGYVHYGANTVAGVLLGWVHLPREVRGRSPVKIPLKKALLFFAAFTVAELFIFPALLGGAPFAFQIAGAFSLVQIGILVAFFFYHRHLLVEFTDDVSALLSERTALLEDARQALALQNQIQAEKLEEQARSLRDQSEVIERQRRLELAAQTAGQASHDIRNLLTPLINYLDILERGSKVNITPQELGRRMRRTVNDLGELNGQLLSLARRGQLELTPLSLHELAREVASRIEGVDLELCAEEESWVSGSWGQLARALTNLIVNAREASNGQRVSVGCRAAVVTAEKRCHLGHLLPGRYVILQVIDKGKGIPREIIDKIFEPFFSSKRSGSGSGSGLGLSIVAAVVEDHKGVLDLTTNSDGTKFELYIPQVSPSDRAELPVEPKRVLLVDDDALLLDGLRHDFERLGCEVSAVSNGKEALQVMEQSALDLIILDLRLPEMDGADLLQELGPLTPIASIVIYSDFISSEDTLRLSAMGATACVSKPASARELLRAAGKAGKVSVAA